MNFRFNQLAQSITIQILLYFFLKFQRTPKKAAFNSPNSPLFNILITIKHFSRTINCKMCTPVITKPKICRRFTFYNQNNDSRSFIINISAFQNQGILDLRAILQYLQDKGLNVDNYLFQIPQFNNAYIDVSKPFVTNYTTMHDRQLIFIMIRKQQSFNRTKEKHNMMESQEKKPKQVQRIIGDVIEKVKYWRWLHSNKGISLKQAAVLANIPKKSLDDYFLQLRQGQLCGYNFAENLLSKMGDLRLYNKKHQKKSGKLPVQLKNIKCFSLVPDIQYNLDMQNLSSDDFDNEIPESSMDVQEQSQDWQQKIEKDFFFAKGKTILKEEDYCSFVEN